MKRFIFRLGHGKIEVVAKDEREARSKIGGVKKRLTLLKVEA